MSAQIVVGRKKLRPLNKESYLFSLTGAPSREQLTDAIFHPNGYLAWTMDFNNPKMKSFQKLSARQHPISRPNIYQQNNERLRQEPFCLFVDMEKDILFLFPKRAVENIDTSSDEISGFYLLANSKVESLGTNGRDEIEIGRLTVKNVDDYIPKPNQKTIERFTKKHGQKIEYMRFARARFHDLRDHVRSHGKVFEIFLLRFPRYKQRTTGKVVAIFQ